jgi:hypothetical protein
MLKTVDGKEIKRTHRRAMEIQERLGVFAREGAIALLEKEASPRARWECKTLRKSIEYDKPGRITEDSWLHAELEHIE